MLDLLNTREWALLIWSLIALAVVLRNPGVRKAANGVVRALLNPRLVAVFCLSAIYIAVGLWVWSLLGLSDRRARRALPRRHGGRPVRLGETLDIRHAEDHGGGRVHCAFPDISAHRGIAANSAVDAGGDDGRLRRN
mgnify:CR=1 FL=1